jgi:hypothetical protein
VATDTAKENMAIHNEAFEFMFSFEFSRLLDHSFKAFILSLSSKQHFLSLSSVLTFVQLMTLRTVQMNILGIFLLSVTSLYLFILSVESYFAPDHTQ